MPYDARHTDLCCFRNCCCLLLTGRLSCWRVCCVMPGFPLWSPQVVMQCMLMRSASCPMSPRRSSQHRYEGMECVPRRVG